VRQPLYCLLPDEAPPAVEIAMRCVPNPGLSVARMVLFYRPPGRAAFTAVPMARSRKGWYAGVVPATAGTTRSVQYYIEARGPANEVATANGDVGSPNLLLIRSDTRRDAAAAEEENPLAVIAQEHARVREEAGAHRRSDSAFWLAVGVGSGAGWHPTRRLEFHDDEQVATGVLRAGLLQVTPEIGRQLGAHYAVSIQGRLQVIPESGLGDARAGAPAHSAYSVLLRVHRFFGLRSAQLSLTGAVGGGDGFRLVVPPTPQEGVRRSDTIRGGPVVFGPGAGFLYHFSRHFAWALEGRVLVGVPDLAALGELSTGAAVSF
jgi:hypothetical protein